MMNENGRAIVARREGNEKALDEFTLEECEKMNLATGMEFICGNGHIEVIVD